MGLILAGGDGTRLRSHTWQIAGDERPKPPSLADPSENLLTEATLIELPEEEKKEDHHLLN